MLSRKSLNCLKTNSTIASRGAASGGSRSITYLRQKQFRTSSCITQKRQSTKTRLKVTPSCQRRALITSTDPKATDQNEFSDSSIRISHILSLLLVCGVGATAWGLYEFYSMLTMWPEEVRGDLRAGLRAKSRGDVKLSIQYLTKAWEKIQELPVESLAPDPYLKLSGVAISLAEVLEAEEYLDEAFKVLQTSLEIFIKSRQSATSSSSSTSASSPSNSDLYTSKSPDVASEYTPTSSTSSSSSDYRPSGNWGGGIQSKLINWLDSQYLAKQTTPDSDPQNRMRVVAIALKLGDLAETLKRPSDEERWLSFAVIEVMKLIYDEYGLVFVPGRGFSEVEDDARVRGPYNDIHPALETISNTVEKTNRNRHGLRSSFDNPSEEVGELGLPGWVKLSKSEIAAPMERLGNFYSRHGEPMNAILLYRLASGLLVRHKTNSTAGDPNVRQRNMASSIPEFCQALQIETAHLFLLIELRRNISDSLSPPSSSGTSTDVDNKGKSKAKNSRSSKVDSELAEKQKQLAQLEREIPLVIKRSVGLYNGAGRGFNRIVGEKQHDADVEPLQSVMTLCEESYPAILYNAAVYYEEIGDMETALTTYELAYKHLRALSGRRFYEKSQLAYEGIRHTQRKLEAARRAQQQHEEEGAGTSSTQGQGKSD